MGVDEVKAYILMVRGGKTKSYCGIAAHIPMLTGLPDKDIHVIYC